MDRDYLKKILEAVLLVSENPVTYAQIHTVFPEITQTLWDEVVQCLRAEYNDQGRGIQLAEVAGGLQLCTAPECAEFLRRLYKTRRVVRLSGAALETLAIIAYKQPVTRAEIEFVRGVNVDGVIKTLEERGLIRERGKKEVPGKPILYGTSAEFLQYFGLKGLDDLPPLENAPAMEGTQADPLRREDEQINLTDSTTQEPGKESPVDAHPIEACSEHTVRIEGMPDETQKSENITTGD